MATSASGPTIRRSAISRWLQCLLYAALFTYLTAIRTHAVSETFWLLGEQIRDWRIAMGRFSALPLTGTPSTAGGTTLGPIYYWTLWLVRIALGPFFSNLPHAGAIGLALIQSSADLLLLYSASKRLRSPGAAFVAVLLVATSPYDVALTATVWNPPLAVALSKIVLALLWMPGMSSAAGSAVVVAASWFAVQAHTGAILVTLPIIAFVVLRRGWMEGPVGSLRAARNAIEVVVLLQIPYAVHHWTHPEAGGMTSIGESITYTIAHPGALRVAESARHVGNAVTYILLQPYAVSWSPYLIAALAVITVLVCWREPDLWVPPAVPLAAAVAAFAVWRGPLTEYYWFLPIVPSAAFVLVLPIVRLRFSRAQVVVLLCAAFLVIVAQPGRCRAAWQTHKLPQYGALIRAARQMSKQAPELRAVHAPWLPPTSDAAFPYEILGGRISETAPLEAFVDPDGRVSYRQ